MGLQGLTRQDQWDVVQAKNSTGSTALHVAAYYGQPQLVELLLEAGANPWHKNRQGWHAGHYATRWSQPKDIRPTRTQARSSILCKCGFFLLTDQGEEEGNNGGG